VKNKQRAHFFKADMDNTHKNQLVHIDGDCVSDPVGVTVSCVVS
jgi:hypothetical protein